MPNDNLGARPTGIDIEQVLADTDVGSPQQTENLEKLSEEVAHEVPPPKFGAANAEILPPAQTSDHSREILTGGFSSTQNVPDYIRGTLEQLNTIQRYFVGRDMQKVQRSQVLKLCRELFEYQYQDMQHVLMLGMDVQKKTRFAQYIDATKSLQVRIQRESAEAQRLVISTMFDNRIEAFKEKNNRDLNFERLHKQGVIDKKQYEKSKEDNEKVIWEHVEKLDQTMQLLITRHAEFLYKTLELFKTKLIERGLLE